jgi:hypothetical protein
MKKAEALPLILARHGLRLISAWSGPTAPAARTAFIREIALGVSAAALVGLFFWQVFITVPHLPDFSADTVSFMQKEPQRGPAIYYFWQLVLSLWYDFYAIAVAQAILLAAVACLLAYSTCSRWACWSFACSRSVSWF